MNKTALYISLACALISNPAHAIRKDHQKHLMVSYALGWSGDIFCREVLGIEDPNWTTACAVTGAVAIGVGKEIYDSTRPNNHFSKSDLAFDVTGAILGAGSKRIYNEMFNVSLYVDPSINEYGLRGSVSF
ncbi:exported hypothetical protein [Vibrio chagasii]|nr:exported hypothetical protein [Vibrio chagasii]